MLLERAVQPVAFDGGAGKLELGKSSRNLGGRKSARPDELVHTGGQAIVGSVSQSRRGEG